MLRGKTRRTPHRSRRGGVLREVHCSIAVTDGQAGREPAATACPACLGVRPGGVSPDVEWYSEQIAPRLCELSLGEIAGALGVSTSSAASSDGDGACRL